LDSSLEMAEKSAASWVKLRNQH